MHSNMLRGFSLHLCAAVSKFATWKKVLSYSQRSGLFYPTKDQAVIMIV